MVTCCTVCGSDETLFGVTCEVSVFVSTKHWRQCKSWNLFLCCLSWSRPLPPAICFSSIFLVISAPVIFSSVSLSLCLSLPLFLSHFFPLTITLRSCAANKSSHPSKWHLNVNAASDVPKPPQCTVSLPTISFVACAMLLCVDILVHIHVSASCCIRRWE